MRREVSYYIREKKRTASNELAHVLKKCIGQIEGDHHSVHRK